MSVCNLPCSAIQPWCFRGFRRWPPVPVSEVRRRIRPDTGSAERSPEGGGKAFRRRVLKPSGAEIRVPMSSRESGGKLSCGGVPGSGPADIVPQFGGPDVSGQSAPRAKKDPVACAKRNEVRKIPGTVLLSHSQIYSTIAAGVLNYRVREGNVCFYSAMGTGKTKTIKKMSS